jgi:hypothetical protein
VEFPLEGVPPSPLVGLSLALPSFSVAMAIWAKKPEAEWEALSAVTQMRNCHHLIQGNNLDPGASVLMVSRASDQSVS